MNWRQAAASNSSTHRRYISASASSSLWPCARMRTIYSYACVCLVKRDLWKMRKMAKMNSMDSQRWRWRWRLLRNISINAHWDAGNCCKSNRGGLGPAYAPIHSVFHPLPPPPASALCYYDKSHLLLQHQRLGDWFIKVSTSLCPAG